LLIQAQHFDVAPFLFEIEIFWYGATNCRRKEKEKFQTKFKLLCGNIAW
jgi:hypothetical protein